ncbi:hypothetical protein GFS24_20140 [Chitinophaga sp. SYP-B3965]|uniref:hypothetical protein n=1 Tax=Chitinophaga sp. SYP-B3965 TaxID=2663120 RepID=UPI001299B175|nr:hypothetical protein [Chitinophaga sp. SYP-B3965]MRG47442.1 hypothetical protein [Chitinophaga sp. SYP-B3965]
MKTSMLILSLFFSAISNAQTAKEVFNSAEIPVTYLGIDFTRAKIMGEIAGNMEILKAFAAINNTVAHESKKYDIAAAIRKTNVVNNLSFVGPRNKAVDVSKIKTDQVSDFTHLAPADIDKLVKEYNFSGQKGIGLLFVVDGMSKLAGKASVYVTFIDMGAKKVLFTERMMGKVGGFGLRNYWAKPFEDILNQIEASKFKEWKGR